MRRDGELREEADEYTAGDLNPEPADTSHSFLELLRLVLLYSLIAALLQQLAQEASNYAFYGDYGHTCYHHNPTACPQYTYYVQYERYIFYDRYHHSQPNDHPRTPQYATTRHDRHHGSSGTTPHRPITAWQTPTHTIPLAPQLTPPTRRLHWKGPLMPRLTPLPPFDASWSNAIDAWRVTMIAHGYSPQTIAARIAQVARMSRDVALPLDRITPATLTAWSAAHTWKPETRYAMHQAVRHFFRDAGQHTLADTLPSIHRPQPVPRPIPDTLLLDALRNADQRTRLMLQLAAEVGMRRGEIAQAAGEDLLDLPTGPSIVVHGKGGKTRIVPIPDDLAAELRQYTGWLFPGQIDGHLSAHRVGDICAAALPGDWTGHKLRHRYATAAYNVAHDLMAVRELLGHASVATTQIYVQVDDDDLRRAANGAAIEPRRLEQQP